MLIAMFHNASGFRKRGRTLNIAQMRMMLTLADSGSMTMTAKKLHVTQPTLTYQLNSIEEELGFKIFNRTRTGTTLTAEGAFLHETLDAIVRQYDETVRLARAMAAGAETGTIRVGTNDYSRDTISYSLNVAQHSISFSLIPCGMSDPIELLREGVIDFWSTSDAALRKAPAALRFTELVKARQSAFIPKGHRLADRASLRLRDFEGETVWLWPNGSASTAADWMRSELERCGADVEDLVLGVPAVVTTFMKESIVIYDDGYLPPPSYTAAQIPLEDSPNDVLGLAYLASQAKRLEPIIADLTEHIPDSIDRTTSKSELAAERIVSVLDDISNTVRRGGMRDIVPLVEYGLELGVSAYHLLNRGLLAGMNATGEAYEDNEIYTTEMMAAVATTNLAMEVLQPYFAKEDTNPVSGSAAIGTVLGDRHDIGKNLVRIMLESRDIPVADLGRQVAPQVFVQHVRNNPNCNLVLISVNRTTLLDNARAVVEAFESAKMRDRVFIMIGGGAATPEFAKEIGADAFTATAEDAAAKAYELMSL